MPNISFNMLCDVLCGPGGRAFIRRCKDEHRPIFAWTVNTTDKMEWCIRRRLDGVITDNPEQFHQLCDDFDESLPERWLSFKVILHSIQIWVFATIFGRFYYSKIDRARPRRATIDGKV